MAGKTISAYTDEATSVRVSQIARLENRKRAQIVGTALKLYVGLPPEVRAAWQEIEAIGSDTLREETMRELVRVFVNARYKLARQEVLKHMKYEKLDELETEEDILDAAVELTRPFKDGH